MSFVVAAAILSLAGLVRPATGQVPDSAATPSLVVPAGLLATVLGYPGCP